jgi:membrane peptidoglycan carboxypeptidase
MADTRGTRPRRKRSGLRAKDSSRPRKTGRFRLDKRWKKVVAGITAFFVLCVAVLGGLVAYAAATLPDINSIGKVAGTIKILDRNGTVIAEVGHAHANQRNVTIDQIAPILQKATVAAEDRNFYNEGAFNPARVLKALVSDLILRRPAQGASTITQQLAKQAFFGDNFDKTPMRKLREALLANQLDSRYSKPEILDLYLNITYYGQNAYGIEAASLRYFGKHAKDLTLMEAALLAGLPQAPSYNDPYNNPDAAYARMHYVVGSLLAVGDITQAQADSVDPLVGGSNPTSAQQAQRTTNQAALTADLKNGQPATIGSAAPHFVQYIQDALQQVFVDDPAALSSDLTVTTTLDLTIQNQATAAVQAGVVKMKSNGANNGALLMIDARTGNIIAMVGSADFNNNAIDGQYNVVTASRRPGSSFKPYVYETGFKNGSFKPSTVLQDTRSESQKLGGVPDFDGRFLGSISAARALLLSRNVPTEQAMDMAGSQNVIDLAKSMGITTPLANNLSTAIGTSAVHMTDHASAYAAFANGGHKVVARGILKITDGKGGVLRDFSQAPNLGDVLTPAQAWSITNILRGYASQWGLRFKWDTAGKSGTTDQFIDSYYMTYTPDWVVATWTGKTGGTQAEQPMNGAFGTVTGADLAVPFVNGLSKPSAFTPVKGALADCSPGGAASANPSSCPTATPSPSPSATTTPTATTAPTDTPLPTPSPIPSILPTPAPTPSPSGGAGGAGAGATPTAGAAPASAAAARRPDG